MRSGRVAITGVIALAAFTPVACSSSGHGSGGGPGAVTVEGSSFGYGTKATKIAAAFACADPAPYRGPLTSSFADAVTCTGPSHIVLLVATFKDQNQYSAAIMAVGAHASAGGKGSATAQGGSFLVTVDTDAEQPAGATFSTESAAVQSVSDTLGVSFGSNGPSN